MIDKARAGATLKGKRTVPLDRRRPHTWNDHQLQNQEVSASSTKPLGGVSPERTASFYTGRMRSSPLTTRTRHADTTGLVRLSLIVFSPVSGTGTLTDVTDVGYCKRGDRCWFLHVDGSEEPRIPNPDSECIICYDRPVTYGLMGASERVIRASFNSDRQLLDGCSHVLCVQVRVTSVDTLRAPFVPISDLHPCHAVYSTVASPQQQNRRYGNHQHLLSLL